MAGHVPVQIQLITAGVWTRFIQDLGSNVVGSIPIVRTSQLMVCMPIYRCSLLRLGRGYSEFLERKYKEMTPKKYNIEKLFMEYWTKRIVGVRDTFFK